MFRIARFCLAVLIAAGVASAADSPFAGTWKLNLAKSEFTGTTISIEQTAAGAMKYTAEGQSYTFNVDGKPYPGPFGSTAAWTQVNPTTWQAVWKMEGKGTVLSTDAIVVSADGRTLTITSKGTTPNGESFENVTEYRRAAGTAGLVGTWKSTKVQLSSPEIVKMSATDGGGLRWDLPAYKASVDLKFDGKDYTATGPTVPPGITLSLRQTESRSFELVQKFGGKIVYRGTYTVSPDGKTMTVFSTAEGTQEKVKAVYDRQ
jgi:hypothetical protein